MCQAQTKRYNHFATASRDYYRLIITIPLLDHLIAETDYRFISEMCNLLNGFYIIPRNRLHCKDVNWKTGFMTFVFAYRDDMPSLRAVQAELVRIMGNQLEERPRKIQI